MTSYRERVAALTGRLKGRTGLPIGSQEYRRGFNDAITSTAALAAESDARIAELEAALAPFARFAAAWEANPLRGIGDTFYSIHTGTEWAAALSLADCKAARAALSTPDAGAATGAGTEAEHAD